MTIEPLLALSYVVLGATCVAWRACNGPSYPASDMEGVVVLVLWPIWLVSYLATGYGRRKR